jgi:4-hydroxy-tetrahydrodipicolinate reductase
MTHTSIKVIVNGAKGRMGTLACTAIDQHQALSVVATLDRDDDLAAAITQHQADVVLDLTQASHALQHATTIINCGARPVIGTSGLLPNDVEHIQKLCAAQQRGGIIAPNFSLGAILMMHSAKQMARFFQHAEIIEHHHPHKKDAPSGTAIKTAEMIASIHNTQAPPMPDTETIPGARGAIHQNIPIHALRMAGVAAKQEVIFGATGETLSITHNTLDRQAYMPGICLACVKVMERHDCTYGLEHVLDLD